MKEDKNNNNRITAKRLMELLKELDLDKKEITQTIVLRLGSSGDSSLASLSLISNNE